MVERLRLFLGATELDYNKASIIQSNDHIINRGTAEIEANTEVISGSTIDFKKNDGSTIVFSANVTERNKKSLWKLKLMTNGYELNNLRVETVYKNKSPEEIVEDIIDVYTSNLTFVSSGVASGVTLTKYVAVGYLVDVLVDMMDVLQWTLRIDNDDNVYFAPKNITANGVTWSNSVDVQVNFWKEEQSSLVNHVKVIGGFESFSTEETITNTSTIFVLEKKPYGILKAVVGGVEISPDVYSVDTDTKTVTFDTSRVNPTFFYSWSRPIVVDNQNDSSIATYGEIFKELPAPWLDSIADARKYSQNILEVYSEPLKKVSVVYPALNFSVDVNEQVRIIDLQRGEDEFLVVSQIVWDASQGTTTYLLGARDDIFYDWQREVQERVKKLERKYTNQSEIVFSRLIKNNIKVSFSSSTVFEESSPMDTFIFGHKTLGRFRSGFDVESDCSDNGNHGVWSGSGVTIGTQFTGSSDVENSVLDLDLLTSPVSGVVVDDSPEGNDGVYKINASAYYPFNGDAVDESVNSNDGTLSTATVIDAMDATTGWTSGNAIISLNNTVFQEGTGALNLIKSGTTQIDNWIKKDIASSDFTGKVLSAYLYIKDATALAKIANVEQFLFSTYTSQYARKSTSPSTLSVGWNVLNFDVANPTTQTGSFDVSAIITIRFDVDTNSVSDTFAEGDIIFDYLQHGAPMKTVDHLGTANNAYSFNGVDNKITITHHADLNIGANDFTFGGYIKPLTTTKGAVISKGIKATDEYFAYVESGYIVCGVFVSGVEKSVSALISQDSYHQFLCVFDTSESLLKLYVDGNLVNTQNTDGATIDTGTDDLIIGEYNSGINDLEAEISELYFIKGVALTLAEVLNLYNVTSAHKLDKPLVTKTDVNGDTITGYELEGTSDDFACYVEGDSAVFLTGTTEGSVYIEFYIEDLSLIPAGSYAIIARSLFGNSLYPRISVANTGEIIFQYKRDTVTDALSEAGGIVNDTIVKLLVTLKDGEQKMYLDNVLVDSETNAVTSFDGGATPYFLGYSTNSSARGVVVSKPIIWDKTLSKAERDYAFSENNGWRLAGGGFNGTNNYITINDDNTIDLNNDLTISLAIKMTTLPSAETYLINKNDGTDGYSLRIATDNTLELVYTDTSSETTFKTTSALIADTMTHYTFTKKGTALTAYINGVSDNTAVGGATIGTNTEDLLIAKESTNYTEIIMDEIRIYNRGLDAKEANNIYNKQHVDNGQVIYLSFDNPTFGDKYSARTTVN